MSSCASIFGGGGGFEVGARAAGLTPVWTVELDPEVASVYERNMGSHAVIGRAEDTDFSTLKSPFWLHMSPVCKNASQAKAGGGEQPEDVAMAKAGARAIWQCFAPQVSLENVWGYRKFESFRIICRALEEKGYAFGFWNLNATDYGVPQTRKRLILLASKTHKPQRPQPTHSRHGDLFTRKWIGWYEAIEDLIPTLPESAFAPWQLKRLGMLEETMLVTNQHAQDTTVAEPKPRTFAPSDPAGVLIADSCSRTRAFIVHGSSTMEVRGEAEPRAYIVDQTTGEGREAGDRILLTRDAGDPLFTLTANPNRLNIRSNVGGRVVSMTPRALARFQSFPDSYVLPAKAPLACRVIGNAVPPLLAQRLVEAEIGAVRERAA